MRRRVLILKLLSMLLATLPPAAAIALYFPLWHGKGAAYVLSGFSVLLTVFAYSPIIKLLKKKLESPSAWGLWLVIFIIFFALERIAAEMCVIGFVGFVSNLAAALIWRAAEK